MPYWRCFYHLVWATKNRDPLITAEFEPFLHRALRHKCNDLEGHILAVNGTPDHIHIVAIIPPKVAISHFMNQLKGSSSRYISLEYHCPFEWQEGYGCFTISEPSLVKTIAYVEKQKIRHANNRLYDPFECITDENEGPIIRPTP